MDKRVWGGVAVAVLLVAGCGDDESGAGDVERYCELSQESDTSTDLPTAEQFEEFLDAAPSEIRDDVETIIDAFQDISDPEDIEAFVEAFETDEVTEAIANIEEFEAENC